MEEGSVRRARGSAAGGNDDVLYTMHKDGLRSVSAGAGQEEGPTMTMRPTM